MVLQRCSSCDDTFERMPLPLSSFSFLCLSLSHLWLSLTSPSHLTLTHGSHIFLWFSSIYILLFSCPLLYVYFPVFSFTSFHYTPSHYLSSSILFPFHYTLSHYLSSCIPFHLFFLKQRVASLKRCCGCQHRNSSVAAFSSSGAIRYVVLINITRTSNTNGTKKRRREPSMCKQV